jgi:L-fuconolactonase
VRTVAAVDSHAHIWPRGLVHPSQKTTQPLAAEPIDLLRAADAASVDVVVILPASIHESNQLVLDAAEVSIGRLRAVAVVDPWAPGAADELERCARSGAIGVRIAPRTLASGFAADPEPLAHLLDAAADVGLAVQWTVSLEASDPIDFAAARHPELRQVLDHLGLPADATDLVSLARVRHLAAHAGLVVKLSGFYALSHTGYPYSDAWPWAEGVVAAFGVDRTMWGSDWPLSTESAGYAAQRQLVNGLPFLDDAGRIEILSGTARRFWGLPRE